MPPEHESSSAGLPEGYAARVPEGNGLGAIYALILACDLAEYGEPDLGEEELRADWEDPDTDRWMVVSPEREIVGYGSVSRHASGNPTRFDAEGYVHPDHVGRGVGRYLLRFAEARARERLAAAPKGAPGAFLANTVNGANAAARDLLKSEGYSPVRHFLRMAIGLQEAPPAPELPEELTVGLCVSEREEHAVFEAVEEAFVDHWGHSDGTLAAWRGRRELAGSRPGWWLMARVGGEVAGAVFCHKSSEGVGEIEWLAVRRTWRRRGLGLTLLRSAFNELRRRGAREVHLVVDSESPTGARRLYERAGMRVERHYAVHRKELRPLGRGQGRGE
ncbi:MAG: GNAT family N-acetyltransferase [Actinomycetota bacterium]|jgi:mycothiol synthase|nr:GNAT family N-acetyltransferase [Actinomycetota bacterium]